MKSQRNILVAFLLNLGFAIFEFVGGLWTGSFAIVSDALHDLADAAGIGISYFLEKKSKKQPDQTHTYGYGRYSVFGGAVTMLILLVGSLGIIVNAARRLAAPTPIRYDGMIVFAVIGVTVNLVAAFVTREGESINQKAVNLHMLEDVLGWAVVLVGAVVMRFTDLAILDPIMSICVAAFIFANALKGLKETADIFLVKTPHGAALPELRQHLMELEGVLDVHHIHLWTMTGHDRLATMHIVFRGEPHQVKEAVREELRERGITHATLELETEGEQCHDAVCRIEPEAGCGHHHHHHHHH